MKFGYKELIAVFFTLSLMAIIVYAAPVPGVSTVQNGGTVTMNTTAGTPGSAPAQGGNVTQYNISQKVQSTNWATFWGTVRGQLVIESGVIGDNTTNYQIYNWSALDDTLTGYVFFSNQSDVLWTNLIACNLLGEAAENTFLGMGTSFDNITETYKIGEKHPAMVIGSQTINADQNAVNTTSTSGTDFQGVLIESNSGDNGRIYTAIIDEDHPNYAGDTADYQIIVPVDSSNRQRTYFVYASLE